MTRQEIIDYIAPETRLFRCDHAILFGSRHAQTHLAAETVDLFQKGYFEKVLVCGGRTHNQDRPEAVEIAEKLITGEFHRTEYRWNVPRPTPEKMSCLQGR